MIQEVLANKQFRKRAVVMKAIKKRIPEIVSLIETGKPSTDEDDWRLSLVSLILYLVEDKNLLEYPEIKRAIEKRLPEFQKSTGFFQPEYTSLVNKKLVNMSDKAAQIWEQIPDITSLTFIYNEGVQVYHDLPEDFPDSIHPSRDFEFNLESLIRQVGESGGESSTKILIILLEQLITQVSHSTYIWSNSGGGYDNWTPVIVWNTVLDWVITPLRDNHDSTVVRPLIELLEQINEYLGEERWSWKIFRILAHYMSNKELNTLRSQYNNKQVNYDYWY
jgi:hypothetical protein